jgi:hypothetical protein
LRSLPFLPPTYESFRKTVNGSEITSLERMNASNVKLETNRAISFQS